MPGNDSYTKLLLHCNGIDGSTSFPDDSAESQTVTAIGSAQVDTAQSKFGGASLLCGTKDDYLSISDFSELDLGSSDFTFDFWVRYNDTTGNQAFFTREGGGADGYFYCAKEGNNIRFRDYTSDVVNMTRAWTPSNDTWYHIAIVRYGNNIKIFVGGTQLGSDESISGSFTARTSNLYIGSFPLANYKLDGWIDEFRFSAGVARWTSNFTPPTKEYSSGETLDIDETVIIDDEWSILTNPLIQNIEEFISIDDSWNIQTNPQQTSIDETVIIDDEWSFDLIGDFYLKYATNLRTSFNQIYTYITNLIVNIFSSNKYNTDLRTKIIEPNKYNTNLRVRIDDYDTISPGNLNDIIVKLDGVELTDVDYSTLQIQYNLNQKPSNTSFVLARRHDNFDYKIDGITYSQISNENKIEIYDGSDKLLTAYINQIEALSETDTISVIAEDVRYKLSRNSMELEYGAKYEASEDDAEVFETFQKSVGAGLNEVFSAISSYISGHEDAPFTTVYTPEYTKTYDNYANLLDTLIRQTANANWYIDEYEYLRFQKVNSGSVKELSLSSLNGSRHVYDVVLSNVSLNKQKSGYAKSLNVKLGKHIIQKWYRWEFTGWMESYIDFVNNLKDKVNFCFQQWGQNGRKWYCGINKTIHGYFYFGHNGGWVLKPTIVVQCQTKDSNEDLDDITVGSGLPRKTLYLNSYGKKEANVRWEERINPDDEKAYLCYVQDDEYDYTNYALDIANFELNQNNCLQTSATVSLLLDAFKYYNIKLKDRINLGNTINSSIYKNNNGFPLNVDSILIDCSKRMVTLELNNYGKSWYVKTQNYLKSVTIPEVKYKMEKKGIVEYSGL